MVMKLETKIEQKARDLIFENLGIDSLKMNVKGNTGWPDRIFWVPGGKPLVIEFKTPNGELSQKQIYHIMKLRRNGYNVEVHDDAIDAFYAAIKAVEALQLSKESRQILDRARCRWDVLRARAGKDKCYSSGDQMDEKARVDE